MSSESSRPRPITGGTRAVRNAAAVSSAIRIRSGAALPTMRLRVAVRCAPRSSIVRSSRRHSRKSRTTRGSSSFVRVFCVSSRTRRSPSGSGIVGARTFRVKSYQLAPIAIAMASASPPTSVRPGYLRSIRPPSFTSSDMPLSHARPRPSRNASLCFSTPPNAASAWRLASSGASLFARISWSVSISM